MAPVTFGWFVGTHPRFCSLASRWLWVQTHFARSLSSCKSVHICHSSLWVLNSVLSWDLKDCVRPRHGQQNHSTRQMTYTQEHLKGMQSSTVGSQLTCVTSKCTVFCSPCLSSPKSPPPAPIQGTQVSTVRPTSLKPNVSHCIIGLFPVGLWCDPAPLYNPHW